MTTTSPSNGMSQTQRDTVMPMSNRATGIVNDLSSENHSGHAALNGGVVKPLLSPKQVSLLCGLHEEVVRRAIRCGELRASKLRGKLRVRQEHLDAWVDLNAVSPED